MHEADFLKGVSIKVGWCVFHPSVTAYAATIDKVRLRRFLCFRLKCVTNAFCKLTLAAETPVRGGIFPTIQTEKGKVLSPLTGGMSALADKGVIPIDTNPLSYYHQEFFRNFDDFYREEKQQEMELVQKGRRKEEC